MPDLRSIRKLCDDILDANWIAAQRASRATDGVALKAIRFSLQRKFGWSQFTPPPR